MQKNREVNCGDEGCQAEGNEANQGATEEEGKQLSREQCGLVYRNMAGYRPGN